MRNKTSSLRNPFVWRALVALSVAIPARAQLTAATQPQQQFSAEQLQLLQQARALNDQGFLLSRAGKHQEALESTRRAVELRKQILGPAHPYYALSLHNLGTVYAALGDHTAAEAALTEAMNVRAQALGERSTEWADSAGWVARELTARHADAEAEALYLKVLDVRKAAEGEASAGYVDISLGLARHYLRTRAPAKAEPLLRRAAEIDAKLLGANHPDVAWCTINLAEACFAQGHFDEAEPLLQRALATCRKAEGDAAVSTGYALLVLGRLHTATSRFAEAEADLRQAAESARLRLGDQHPDYAVALLDLGYVYRLTRDVPRGEPVLLQAMEIRRRAFGAADPRTAACLGELAILYKDAGDFAKAELAYRGVCDVYRRACGENRPEYATQLHNFAVMYQEAGDLTRAAELYAQAAAIAKTSAGEWSREYALSECALACLDRDAGRTQQAIAGLEHAREAFRRAGGERNVQYVMCLTGLADTYRNARDYAKADPLYVQAIAIQTEIFGGSHPYVAEILHNCALGYEARGEYDKAEPLLLRATEVIKQGYGERHKGYATCLDDLARLAALKGDDARAAGLARQALPIVRGYLESVASIEPEREQLNRERQARPSLDGYLSYSAAANVPAAEAYAQVLGWKGSVWLRQRRLRTLRSMAAGNAPGLLAEAQAECARAAVKAEDATRRLAALVAGGGTPDAAVARQRDAAVADLVREVESAQADLSRLSAPYRALLSQDRRTPADLMAALPPRAALVDVFAYERFNPHPTKETGAGTGPSLVAFVLVPGRGAGTSAGEVRRVELGPVAPINDAGVRWIATNLGPPPADGGDAARAAGADLRRLVWEPLAAAIGKDADTVVVSPDGPLDYLSLAALPGKAPGSYLIEDLAVATLAVPQALPEVLAPVPAASGDAPTFLLVGDVVNPAAQPLPGARAEVDKVGELFAAAFPDARARALTGAGATKAAVREHLAGRTWMHFATHGYLATGAATDFYTALSSGLVLSAGDHAATATGGDAILTSLEVEQSDLSDTDLAVLSACGAALGRPSTGEGVLSLQRAFQVAGARTVIASQWLVDDAATRDLMTTFYRNRWEEHLGKLPALRDAQIRAMRQGMPEGQRRPPRDWAGFVLSGDWR